MIFLRYLRGFVSGALAVWVSVYPPTHDFNATILPALVGGTVAMLHLATPVPTRKR